jgi:type IV secretory pathway VirB10-like protein
MWLADLPFDPNVIVVLVAVIFAAVKAFLERNQDPGADEGEDFPSAEMREVDREFDDSAYEDELRRQRQEREMPSPVVVPPKPDRKRVPVSPATPPPLPGMVPQMGTKRPSLSEAERKALANLKRRSQEKSQRKRPRHSTRSRVVRHLSSPTAAREALVLAEVLGRPKALSKPEH